MNVAGSIDVTDYIRNSGIAERLTPYMVPNQHGDTRTALDFTFSLSVRPEDRKIVLDIQKEKGFSHRSMVVDTQQKKLGLSITLSARDVTTLIREALPLLTAPERPITPYSAKNSLAA